MKKTPFIWRQGETKWQFSAIHTDVNSGCVHNVTIFFFAFLSLFGVQVQTRSKCCLTWKLFIIDLENYTKHKLKCVISLAATEKPVIKLFLSEWEMNPVEYWPGDPA